MLGPRFIELKQSRPELMLATNNPGKIKEYSRLLATCGYQLVTPAEKDIELTVPETGSTFEENAVLKATAYARVSGLLTLADDSGLEVKALDGAPGVLSARYAGPAATDADRNALLLRQLKNVPAQNRGARFRCVIVIAVPGGAIKAITEGVLDGRIAAYAKGGNGFGYDPVFFIGELNRTLAELAPEEKNRLSHRARAAEDACRILGQMCHD